MRYALWLLAILSALGCSTTPAKKETASQTPAIIEDSSRALSELEKLERGRSPAAQVTPYLKHNDKQVRARAALALARIADPDGAAGLILALRDKSPQVRINAAFGLGVLDPVLPLLADQITSGHKGDEPWVRKTAYIRADAERALDVRLHLEHNPAVRRAIYAALGQLVIGPGLHYLHAGLDGSDFEATHAALAYGIHAVRRGTSAHRTEELTQKLIKLGANENADLRYAAVFALARHKIAAAEMLFAQRLMLDSDVRVRIWSARGLGVCPGSTDALLTALDDDNWRVRAESLRALGSRAQRGVDAPKKKILKVAERAVRSLKADPAERHYSWAHVLSLALRLLKSQQDVESLQALLQRGSKGEVSEELRAVHCELAIARAALTLQLEPLSKCSGTHEQNHLSRLREIAALARASARKPPLIARLHTYLSDQDPRVRVAAIQALAGANDAASRAILRTRLAADTDPAAVEAIADTISTWPADDTLVHELTQALQRTETPKEATIIAARVALAKALAKHGRVTAAKQLAQLADEDVLQVRNAIHRELGTTPVFGQAPPFGDVKPMDIENLAARIRTIRGTITLRLYSEEAPLTVANFVRLARNGFYDGLLFHRVVPGFVIQAGDPRGDGYGGPGYSIPCEVTPRHFTRGVVGMALAGRDTGGSQFFIMQSTQPHLDGYYTAFAEVTSGLDALDAVFQGDAILGIDIVPAEETKAQPVIQEQQAR